MADASQAYASPRLQTPGLETSPPDFAQQALWTPNPAALARPERGNARLVRAIETEVLPRLLLACRQQVGLECAPTTLSRAIGTPDEVTAFTTLVLESGMAAASYIDDLRSRNISVEQIYLELLAPSARWLGELWVSDMVDFTQVTIGVGHLQLLLRHLGAMRVEASGHPHRRVLLLPAAGEQHSFGLVMVAEFFRQAGWDVCCGVGVSIDDSIAMVHEQSYSVFGLSLSGENHLDATAQQIRAMRRASKNRAIGALVGGNVFVDHPEYVSMLGADATAVDGQQAVAQAHNMVGLLGIQC